MIYFTSDLHFSHTNIMEYCGRRFKNVDMMNNHIIKQYNKIVQNDDTCYILGDLTLSATKSLMVRLINKLHGKKILIVGNHDRFAVQEYYEMGFSAVHGHLKLRYNNNTEVCVAHDPAWAQVPDTIWFCGHVHNMFRKIKTLTNTTIVNVGIDVWDYKPQSFDFLVDYAKTSLKEEEIFNCVTYPFRKKGRELTIDHIETEFLNKKSLEEIEIVRHITPFLIKKESSNV